MTLIIILVLAGVISSLLVFSDSLLTGMWDLVFNVEAAMRNVDFANAIGALKNIFYAVGIGLLILKFCKKAFDVYVLWSDGDPDVEPTGLIISFVKAIVVAICFPMLWQWFVDIGGQVVDASFAAISGDVGVQSDWLTINWTGLGLLTTLLALVFLIMVLILYIKFMMRGLEITFMIVGVPIACTGLLENDKGVWKPYLNQFVKAIFTTIIQILLVKLGLIIGFGASLVNLDSIIWGIACMFLALSAPKIMSEFLLVNQGGGGFSQKVFSTSMAFNQIKHIFGK